VAHAWSLVRTLSGVAPYYDSAEFGHSYVAVLDLHVVPFLFAAWAWCSCASVVHRALGLEEANVAVSFLTLEAVGRLTVRWTFEPFTLQTFRVGIRGWDRQPFSLLYLIFWKFYGCLKLVTSYAPAPHSPHSPPPASATVPGDDHCNTVCGSTSLFRSFWPYRLGALFCVFRYHWWSNIYKEFTPQPATKAQRVSRGIALLFL
jgi:hypothetical protein